MNGINSSVPLKFFFKTSLFNVPFPFAEIIYFYLFIYPVEGLFLSYYYYDRPQQKNRRETINNEKKNKAMSTEH